MSRALRRRSGARRTGAAADTIFFGGGTPSLLEPAEIGASSRVPRAVRAGARRRDHAGGQPRDRDAASGSPGFCAAGVNRLSFGVQSFRDEELQRLGRMHTAARAREAFRDGARGRVRQRLARPDDVAAAAVGRRVARIGRGAHRARSGSRVAVPAGDVSERAAAGAMARGRWSLAPDDDAADMYLGAWTGSMPPATAVRDFECLASGTRVAAQPEILDRRGVAWVRLRRPLHADGVRWKNVAATRSTLARGAGGQLVAERRILSDQEQLEEALFTGLGSPRVSTCS